MIAMLNLIPLQTLEVVLVFYYYYYTNYSLICIKAGLCIVIQNTNKIEAGNTSYFESGCHVEWSHSRIEST